MKRAIAVILASIFISPFIARSQNEGIKVTSNPDPVLKAPMPQKTTQEMALMQGQGTTGGATSPSGHSSNTGSIYLEPGWAPGQVMLNDQRILENILLRYDIYHQQIQFIKDNDTMAFSKPEEIKFLILDGRNFIYTEFVNNGIIGKGYFEILTDGSCKLMVRRYIKYHINPDTETLLKEHLYIMESEYYLMKEDEMPKYIKACRKSVLCAFKDKEEQVKDYMSENNIKLKTCDQLKQVVKYYNGLP